MTFIERNFYHDDVVKRLCNFFESENIKYEREVFIKCGGVQVSRFFIDFHLIDFNIYFDVKMGRTMAIQADEFLNFDNANRHDYNVYIFKMWKGVLKVKRIDQIMVKNLLRAKKIGSETLRGENASGCATLYIDDNIDGWEGFISWIDDLNK